MPKLIAILTLLIAWGVYFINFDPFNGFPTDKAEWGTFGDFIGGVTNPILTFLSIIMLIRSLKLQKDANSSILSQNEQLLKDSLRQKEIDDLRSFESSFYNLAEVARKGFENFKLTGWAGEVYDSSFAVNFLEKHMLTQSNLKSPDELTKHFTKMDDVNALAIYSVVRSFYVLIKFTNETCPEKHKNVYFDICNHIMPIKFLHLVCLSYVFGSGKIYEEMKRYEFFKRSGISDYINAFVDIKKRNA